MAAATIGPADVLGLPVTTTHVLSSGIAGTMAANGPGCSWPTVRNIALAWSHAAGGDDHSGALYWVFSPVLSGADGESLKREEKAATAFFFGLWRAAAAPNAAPAHRIVERPSSPLRRLTLDARRPEPRSARSIRRTLF